MQELGRSAWGVIVAHIVGVHQHVGNALVLTLSPSVIVVRIAGVVGLASLPVVALRSRAVYRFVRELGPPARRRWFRRTIRDASIPILVVCAAVDSFDPPPPIDHVLFVLIGVCVFSVIGASMLSGS